MFRKVVQIILLWVPFFMLLVMVGVPFLILCCYRFTVTVFLRAVLRKMDLTAPITKLDFGFSADDFWHHPLGAIAGVYVLEGPVSANSVLTQISKVLTPEGPNRNSKHDCGDFKRLTRLYPSFWLGYPFWTKSLPGQFEVKNHIRVHDPKVKGLLSLNEVLKNWVESPFEINKPLWDILLIPELEDVNAPDNKRSVLAFRIHHIVGDGCSVVEFLDKIYDRPFQPMIPGSKGDVYGSSLFQTVKNCLIMPLTIWNHFQDFVVHTDIFDTVKRDSGTSMATTTLALTDLKTIRRQLSVDHKIPGVTMLTVISFIFGFTLRKALLNGNFVQTKMTTSQMKRMKNINVAIGLTKATTHPTNGFCNHWNHAVYEIPICDENPLDRLRKTVCLNKSNLKDSCLIGANEIILNLHSIFPRCLYSYLHKHVRGTTIGMVNMPGPQQSVTICGKNVVEIFALIGLQLKQASFTLGFVSYNNEMTLTLLANHNVFSQEDAQKFVEIYKEEVANLVSHGIGNDSNVEPGLLLV